jgi:hypothetical protein
LAHESSAASTGIEVTIGSDIQYVAQGSMPVRCGG